MNKRPGLLSVVTTVVVVAVACCCCCLPPVALAVQPTYTQVASLNGRALAYADFNADSLLDVLAVSSNQSQLLLYLWQKSSTTGGGGVGVGTPTEVVLAAVESGSQLVGAVPADFNGDSRVDILLSVRSGSGSASRLSVQIAYGLPDRDGVTKPQEVTMAVDQPTVLDYNADMVADFLVEREPGKRVVFTGRLNENRFNNQSGLFPGSWSMAVPNANLFTDMNGDLRSDLLLRYDKSSSSMGYVMGRTDSGFDQQSELPRPDGLGTGDDVYIGQLVPLSLDNDELADLAMPACKRNSDGACATSWLYLYSGSARRWCRAKVDEFEAKKYNWHLQPDQPVQLRAGDLDLDGQLDLLATLRRQSDGHPVPAFLTPGGVDCAASAAAVLVRLADLPPCPAGLALWGTALADVNQDGGLDLMQLCTAGSGSSGRWSSVLYAQQYNEEGYFFRSLVLNGMCSNAYNCPGGRLPVGLPVPGPCLRFTTERPEGGTRIGIGCQLSQSAYSQLDLPYLHFGLGQFSNYIDRLTVAIPYASGLPLHRDFTFIIPNSQLLVVPSPHGSPASWTSELFVRPFYDKQVLYVGVTLLGTCLVACIIAAVFQCLEYRKDKLERVAGQQGVVFDPSGR